MKCGSLPCGSYKGTMKWRVLYVNILTIDYLEQMPNKILKRINISLKIPTILSFLSNDIRIIYISLGNICGRCIVENVEETILF